MTTERTSTPAASRRSHAAEANRKAHTRLQGAQQYQQARHELTKELQDVEGATPPLGQF
ncbi:conserved hypothetical protein [Ricinus communis]|uniref:Uncharacterized protein n=1 Tax=Ricinus communis TaxID=3988 RepID=B9SFY1_RICCO|nr:conserved hypothetical protein [Ricinus communis]